MFNNKKFQIQSLVFVGFVGWLGSFGSFRFKAGGWVRWVSTAGHGVGGHGWARLGELLYSLYSVSLSLISLVDGEPRRRSRVRLVGSTLKAFPQSFLSNPGEQTKPRQIAANPRSRTQIAASFVIPGRTPDLSLSLSLVFSDLSLSLSLSRVLRSRVLLLLFRRWWATAVVGGGRWWAATVLGGGRWWAAAVVGAS